MILTQDVSEKIVNVIDLNQEEGNTFLKGFNKVSFRVKNIIPEMFKCDKFKLYVNWFPLTGMLNFNGGYYKIHNWFTFITIKYD